MNNHGPVRMNIVYIFFEDDFSKWANAYQIESFIKLNKGIRVIGVNFPVSLATLLCNPVRFAKYLIRNKSKVQEGIYSFAPFSFLPLNIINRYNFLIKLHRWLFKLQFNCYLKKIDALENRVIFINDLEAAPAFSEIVDCNKLLVYDCRDEHTYNEDTLNRKAQEIENDILNKADIVFTVAEFSYKSRLKKNKNTFLIPNGADYDLFKQADSEDTPIHHGLDKIPRPIVGYLGNTRSWLDFELLEFLADRLPSISFVFVGPVEKDIRHKVDSLKKHNNVYFFSRIERKYLPSVLKPFSVCIIPFKFNRFNLSTSPIKFWEYLATGKPILSLKIPDFACYEDLVALYTTKEEALSKLQGLLMENSSTLKLKRMTLAKNSDVSLRSKQRYDVIVKFLNTEQTTSEN